VQQRTKAMLTYKIVPAHGNKLFAISGKGNFTSQATDILDESGKLVRLRSWRFGFVRTSCNNVY